MLSAPIVFVLALISTALFKLDTTFPINDPVNARVAELYVTAKLLSNRFPKKETALTVFHLAVGLPRLYTPLEPGIIPVF